MGRFVPPNRAVPTGTSQRPAVGGVDQVREARGRGKPVTVVRDGIDARVVGVAFLVEDRERPRRLPPDRVVRRAIPQDGASGGLLEHVLGGAHVVPEPLGPETVDRRVIPPVRGQLVAARDDRPAEPREPLGHHAEREERPVRAVLVEHVEQPLGLRDDAARQPMDVRAQRVAELHAVVVLLDVHGEDVGDRRLGLTQHERLRASGRSGRTIRGAMPRGVPRPCARRR